MEPAGQRVTQAPLTQALPDGQTTAHAPQLRLSLRRSTHRLPQSADPLGHVVLQVPLTQAVPVGHAFPHPPQFRLSLCRSTQRWLALGPQAVSPAGQEIVHAPFEQA